MQEISYQYTRYEDIVRYMSKKSLALFLPYKDSTGWFLLDETDFIVYTPLHRSDPVQHPQEARIPYTDIRAIIAEPMIFKNKFITTQFTIARHSALCWQKAADRLLSESQDEDLYPEMVGGPEFEEDIILYSSVRESKANAPCSLQKALDILQARLN